MKAVMLYNVMVMGIHQYYGIATEISDDCDRIGWAVNITLKNRLKWRLKRKPKGSPLLLYGENAGRYAKTDKFGISVIWLFTLLDYRHITVRSISRRELTTIQLKAGLPSIRV